MPEPTSSLAGRLAGMTARLRRPVATGAYHPEIDGLRFIAIAVVVLGHFAERAMRFFPTLRNEIEGTTFGTLVQRPGLGVYLFFAVSGFIITCQAMRARTAPLSPSFLKAYFGRRVLRIEPPYVLLLVVTWLALILTGYRPEQTHHFDTAPQSMTLSLAGSIVYLHDLVWGTFPRLFPAGWSLEVEVQFYVLAPLLFAALFLARHAWVRIAIGGLGLLIGAYVSCVAPHAIGPIHTQMSILRFFHFFWLGMMIALAKDHIAACAERVPALLAGPIGWLGLVAYLVIPSATDTDIAQAMVLRAATLLALAAMFFGVFATGSSFRRFCARPWISVIGGACYSIYLTHLQTMQALTSVFAKLVPHAGLATVVALMLIEFAAVLVVGMTFYALVERTFMAKDWPQRLRRWLAGAAASPDLRTAPSPARSRR